MFVVYIPWHCHRDYERRRDRRRRVDPGDEGVRVVPLAVVVVVVGQARDQVHEAGHGESE